MVFEKEHLKRIKNFYQILIEFRELYLDMQVFCIFLCVCMCVCMRVCVCVCGDGFVGGLLCMIYANESIVSGVEIGYHMK